MGTEPGAVGKTLLEVGGVGAAAERLLAQHAQPGLVLAAQKGEGPVELLAVGADCRGKRLEPDSLLPLSSLGKLAIGLVVLKLVEQQVLSLDEPVASWVPEAAVAKSGATVRMLLTHSAGLPFVLSFKARQLPKEQWSWAYFSAQAMATNPLFPPRTRVLIGGIGADIVTVIAERAAGQPFSKLLEEQVIRPLRLDLVLGVPTRAAAAVQVAKNEEGTTHEQFNSVWFQQLAWPSVSMLATTASMLGMVRAYDPARTTLLTRGTAQAAVENQTGELGGGVPGSMEWPRCEMGLGVIRQGGKTDFIAPASAGEDSFGFFGGHGSFAWHSPRHDLSWAVGSVTYVQPGPDSFFRKASPALSEAILGAYTQGS